MKTDYTSLRSQIRNFSDFYASAINEAKKQVLRVRRMGNDDSASHHKPKRVFCFLCQISAVISEMSEANKDLLEKYRKEVALRRKYHEQLVELKGMMREQNYVIPPPPKKKKTEPSPLP